MNFRPMLSGKVEDYSKIKFPAVVSPKLDGVRCIIIDGVAMSRSLKPIPNKYVQKILGSLGPEANGLDGELVVGDITDPQCYRNTTSGVMSVEGEPEFRFHVFDKIDHDNPSAEFSHRMWKATSFVNELLSPHVFVVPHKVVTSEEELIFENQKHLQSGFEGLMVRSPDGPYKMGRSTLKEGYLLKIKLFYDKEATIVGMEELMHNDNVAKKNELGLTERSTKKENKRPSGKMGKLIVECPDFDQTFKIGTGFTDQERKDIWKQGEDLIGQKVKFKYQEAGTYVRPRSPVFLGFRNDIDL